MTPERYNPSQDYCKDAIKWQSVPNAQDTENYLISKNKPHESQDVYDSRMGTLYSCPDNYRMGSIQDNQIYIATTDDQHAQLVKREHVDANGGLSGYFSDQATVDACKTGEVLDNTKYNEMCQIAPHRFGGIEGEGDATYKPHVDCLEIDRDALYRNYETYDFNAAIAKCEANNHFGSGGGNQGYNPYISEMIDNGSLRHNPNRSYSDSTLSKGEHNNQNSAINSVVPEDKAEKMYADAQTRAQDCVNNNTRNPSSEACNNGYLANNNPVSSETGNARISLAPSDADLEKAKAAGVNLDGLLGNPAAQDHANGMGQAMATGGLT